MARYELSQVIDGHSGDVKSVAFSSADRIVTTSRDGTALLSPPGTILYTGDGFLNAVACVGSTVFVGGQDGVIVGLDVTGAEEDRYFMGHAGNVSSLATHAATGQLVSGSWDFTARVWQSPDSAVVLKGHDHFVWDVDFVDETRVLTVSADKTIGLWDSKSGRRLSTWRGHSDVVRGVCSLGSGSNRFATVSNDGSIRIWSLDSPEAVAVWKDAHTSFIYSVAYNEPENLLYTSGEDRSVRVWDVATGKCLQVVTMPGVSQWKVAVDPKTGDFAVGASDHTARIFTRSPERLAPEAVRTAFEEAVASSALGEDQVAPGVAESQLSDPSVLDSPGASEGQTVMVRRGPGPVEAWQFGGGRWAKIGDVMGGDAAGSDGAKQEFEGKKYDYVFDVDIHDDAPPLKLPFNVTDNVYVAADRFIARHTLPTTYRDQVVQFLLQNTRAAATLGPQSQGASSPGTQPTAGPSQPSTQSSTQQPSPDVLRYNTTLAIKSVQADAASSAFKRVATAEKDPAAGLDISSILASLPGSSAELLNVSLEAVEHWEILHKLPALDLLRLALADAPSIPDLKIYVTLLSCIDPGVPKHALLAVRGFVNLLSRSDARSAATGKNAGIFTQALQMLRQFESVTAPMAIAASTLILNMVVLDFTDSAALAATTQWLVPHLVGESYNEAKYRLGLAIGVRVARNRSEAGLFAPLRPFLKSGGEKRFVDLSLAVQQVL